MSSEKNDQYWWDYESGLGGDHWWHLGTGGSLASVTFPNLGTKGEIRWTGAVEDGLSVHDFATKKDRKVANKMKRPDRPDNTGKYMYTEKDFFLLNAMCKAVASKDPSLIFSNLEESYKSHKLVFAAERSRLNGTIENV